MLYNQKNSFNKSPYFSESLLLYGKIKYQFTSIYRFIRVLKPVSLLFGVQYTRSRDMIEIDITYDCNLMCHNCNRSSTQAPEKLHISIERIQGFVDESIKSDKYWKRIRVLGGEPTLHPNFIEIIDELLRYKSYFPSCLIEVVTNGYGEKVKSIIKKIPKEIWIENSEKQEKIQPDFGPFNLAPIDEQKYAFSDYSNGCSIMSECGMGLTTLGYYPCAVAGGIDRILGESIGYKYLPDDSDNMEQLAKKLCQYCGRFRDGHFVPKNLRKPLMKQETSKSWEKLYANWRKSDK